MKTQWLDLLETFQHRGGVAFDDLFQRLQIGALAGVGERFLEQSAPVPQVAPVVAVPFIIAIAPG